jgi:hypothetical protein
VLALVRYAKLVCENANHGYLSEEERQATIEAVDLFEWIETDLEAAETHFEMLEAITQAKELFDNQ